jgi:SAM-dependent methyltransferase
VTAVTLSLGLDKPARGAFEMDSFYYDKEKIDKQVRDGDHRALVGGMWDEIGALQFNFLKSEGLSHNHKLLDIGCGCLRVGVHLINYLDAGNYFGVDLNESLLDAGYRVELARARLTEKLPRDRLRRIEGFDFSAISVDFDIAIAFSVFTHISLNSVRICLERLAPKMKVGGRFYATIFERPHEQPSDIAITHPPAGVVTHGDCDPYHYSLADLRHISTGLPWTIHPMGEFGHPRGQRMVLFRRVDYSDSRPTQAELGLDAVRGLPAGSDHYKAYVGPPDRFDFMSATQFALLFQLGLREQHRVLDFGCGSLRLGRLLIPYLNRGCYFGIDPNRWLIDDGISNELGAMAIDLKMPSFSQSDSFRTDVFGCRFDFLIAQSIVTHTGPDLTRKFLLSVPQALKPDGLFLFSYIRDDNVPTLPRDGWHYPEIVAYSRFWFEEELKKVGLVSRPLPWFHPGATWHAAALSAESLPPEDQMDLLNGAVLRSEQFSASVKDA